MNILETKIEEMVIESCNSLLNFEETHTEEAAIAAILAKMNLKV